MNLARSIAWRYLKRPTDKLVSAVGIVSVLGLIIGVMALVISMALMTGYRDDLQKKLLGANAEVFLYAVDGNIANTPETLKTVRQTRGVATASPVIFQHGLVSSETFVTGAQVMLKGIEPARVAASPFLQKIVGTGKSFQTREGLPGVTLGKHLAGRLGVDIGSPLMVTVPTEQSGNVLPQTASFTVTNVFDSGFYEFDAGWVFLDLAEAQRMTGAPASANLVEIELAPKANIDNVIAEVASRTGHRYAVTDWRQMNGQLFSLLELQQLVLFIVIGLIVFVSTFNIVSTLIMTIHEKRKEIGMLASMGAEKRLITRIFVWYGAMVGLIGTGAGIVLGTIICAIITKYRLISFPPEIAEVYFVSSIPFITSPRDLSVIAAFSVGVSFLATLLPAMRASRLNPIDALRHE